MYSVGQNEVLIPPSYNKYLALGFADLSVRIGNYESVYSVEQNKVLISPSNNKYRAWGFADLSVRIGNYESVKVSVQIYSVVQNKVLIRPITNTWPGGLQISVYGPATTSQIR